MIVLDDGSDDKSLEIVESIRDDRVRVEYFEHGGIGVNFNRCIERAQGRYLKILPQDDTLHPNCLSEMSALLAKTDRPSLAFSRREILYDPADPWSIRFMKKHAQPDTPLQPLEAVNDGPSLLRRWKSSGMLTRNLIGEPVAAVFPVELAKSIGGFSTSMNQNLDFLFWIRLAARGDVCFSERTLCSFRLHASGTSHRNYLAGKLGHLELEKLLLLQELACDSEVASVLPDIDAMIEREREHLAGLPVKKYFYFWRLYHKLADLEEMSCPYWRPRSDLELDISRGGLSGYCERARVCDVLGTRNRRKSEYYRARFNDTLGGSAHGRQCRSRADLSSTSTSVK